MCDICGGQQHHRAQPKETIYLLHLGCWYVCVCVCVCVSCEVCPNTFLTVVVSVRYLHWHEANTDLCYTAAAMLKLQFSTLAI